MTSISAIPSVVQTPPVTSSPAPAPVANNNTSPAPADNTPAAPATTNTTPSSGTSGGVYNALANASASTIVGANVNIVT